MHSEAQCSTVTVEVMLVPMARGEPSPQSSKTLRNPTRDRYRTSVVGCLNAGCCPITALQLKKVLRRPWAALEMKMAVALTLILEPKWANELIAVPLLEGTFGEKSTILKRLRAEPNSSGAAAAAATQTRVRGAKKRTYPCATAAGLAITAGKNSAC